MRDNKWKACTVGDIAAPVKNSLVGGPFGSNLVSADYVARGIPVIRGENMGHGRWVGGEFVYVTQEKAESLSSNLARAGDIVFTQRGTLGQVAIIPSGAYPEYLISQSQMKLTPDKKQIDPMFLYYVFASPVQQDYIRRNAIQTGVPHTNLGILRGTPIVLPPLSDQRAVAAVLGALDDKIELNRRMDETLEATARAIFKSWFVDFGPVDANAAGRQPPALSGQIAALFPSYFASSHPERLPHGWSVSTVSDVADVIKGRSYSSEDLKPSRTALVTLKSFKRGGGYRADGLKPFIGSYNREQVVTPGELIVAFTDVTQAAEVVGKPAIVLSDPLYDTLVASLDVGIVRPKHADLGIGFLYCLFTTPAFSDHTYARSTGTTVLHLSKDAVPSFKFVRPGPKVSKCFENIVHPMLARIEASELECRTLAALRDTLLPKLLSGELTLNRVEKTLEAAL